MRQLVFVVMSLMWGLALPATVYKWVDENGVTHYSDQPYPGAKKLEVQAAQTYKAPPPPPVRPTAAVVPGAASSTDPYKTCELFRPTADEVFFNVSSVTAKLRLDPDLRTGDKVAIALDGKRVTGLPTAGEEYTVNSVFRGTHSLMAVVEDARGAPVCKTSPVTFHVRQASQLSPRSPTRPAPPPRTTKPGPRP